MFRVRLRHQGSRGLTLPRGVKVRGRRKLYKEYLTAGANSREGGGKREFTIEIRRNRRLSVVILDSFRRCYETGARAAMETEPALRSFESEATEKRSLGVAAPPPAVLSVASCR